VPKSTGASFSFRGAFAPSLAARYRELRVNRGVYVLAILALAAPWALWVMQVIGVLETLPSMISLTLRSFAQGFDNFANVDLVVSAAFGIALFGYDRAVGGLLYALEGPLKRRDVWLAKAWFGMAAILLVAAAGTAFTLVAAAVSGNLSLAGPILLRSLFDAAGQLELFVTALAMGGVMGTVFACLATATWAGLPSLLSGFAQTALVRETVVSLPNGVTAIWWVPYVPWVISLSNALNNLSPFQPNGFTNWPFVDVLLLIASYLAWAACLVWAAPRWWERAPFERLHDGVFFPALWNFYYAFLSAFSGLVITTLLTRGSIKGIAWTAIYAGTFIAGWFFWRAVVTRRGVKWRWAIGVRM
jgi:hypothetical protein